MILLDRRPHRHHFGETSMIKRLLECQYSAHSLPETYISITLPTGNSPTCSPTPLPFLLLYFTMSLGSLDPNLLKTLGTCLVHLDNISKHSIQYWGSHPYTFIHNRKDTWTCSHRLHEPLIVEATSSEGGSAVLLQSIEEAPAIFSVVRQLAKSKPIYETTDPHNHSGTCSFWVENRPDPASKTFWQRIPKALEAIVSKHSSYSDISNLYDVDQDTGTVSMHIQWASDEASDWSSVGNSYQISLSFCWSTLQKQDHSGDSASSDFIREATLKSPPEAVRILFSLAHRKEVFPDDGWDWDFGTVTYCASLISAGAVWEHILSN